MNDEEILEEAKKIVMIEKKVSASLLQRKLQIGYFRAANVLDLLEEQGIIGKHNGAKPREVFIKDVANN